MPTRRICPNCRTPTFAEGVTCRACRHEMAPSAPNGRPQTAQLVAAPPFDEPAGNGLSPSDFAADEPELHDEDELEPAEPNVFTRLGLEWRTNALLITSIVFASLGWGGAIGVLSSMQHVKPAPATTTVNSVLTADLSQKLHERDQELSSLMSQFRTLSAQLDAARHTSDARAAQVEKADNARTAAREQLDAESGTLSSLRQQVADLKTDNAGLEQNYNDLLNSLHRTQDEAFRDERLLVAAAAAQKRADERVAEFAAAVAKKYHKGR